MKARHGVSKSQVTITSGVGVPMKYRLNKREVLVVLSGTLVWFVVVISLAVLGGWLGFELLGGIDLDGRLMHGDTWMKILYLVILGLVVVRFSWYIWLGWLKVCKKLGWIEDVEELKDWFYYDY